MVDMHPNTLASERHLDESAMLPSPQTVSGHLQESQLSALERLFAELLRRRSV
jgi:hypothetical protein